MELERMAYGVNETAKLLGVSRTRLYTLMEQGHLFYIQPGGHRLIPAEAIQAFLEGREYAPNKDIPREAQTDISTWPPTPSMLDSDIGYGGRR